MREAADQISNKPDRFAADITATRHFVNQRLCERGAETSFAFAHERDEILYSIMVAFYESNTSHNKFKSFFNHFQPDFRSDRTVFVTDKHGFDRILTSGINLGYIEQALYADGHENHDKEILRFCQGNNLLGLVLKRVFQRFTPRQGRDGPPDEPKYSVYDLIRCNVMPTNEILRRYSRSVALCSDSYFRCAEKVEFGDIFYRGGIKCCELAHLLTINKVYLSHYLVIILCIGTNDSKHDEEYWESSWGEIYQLLNPLLNDDNHIIIMNTGIGSSDWPRIPAYARWLRENMCGGDGLFGPNVTNTFLIDWSEPGPTNPFIDAGRNPIPRFMFRGHPNALGLTVMLKRWIDVCPKLANFEFSFTDERPRYLAGQLPWPRYDDPQEQEIYEEEPYEIPAEEDEAYQAAYGNDENVDDEIYVNDDEQRDVREVIEPGH